MASSVVFLHCMEHVTRISATLLNFQPCPCRNDAHSTAANLRLHAGGGGSSISEGSGAYPKAEECAC